MMEEHQRNVDTCVRDNQLPQESIQIGCYDHQVPPFPSHDHDHSNNSTSVLDSSSVSSTVPLSREDFKRKVWKNKQILQDQAFWKQIIKEMRAIDYQTEEFRSQTEIPLRPIRRVMCQEGDLGINKVMFSAESGILFSKACEVFILELTLRGWGNADADKRRILSKKDLVTSCYESDMYDFLVDVIPPQKQSQSKSKSKSRPQPQPLPQPQSQSQSHLARIPHATTQAQTMHEQRYLQQLQQQQLQLQQQQQLQQQLQLQQEHILIPQSTTLPIDAHAMALYYQHLQQTEPQIQIPTLPQQVQVQKHNHQQTNALPQNDIQQINSQVRSSEAELAPWQTAVGAHALSPPPQTLAPSPPSPEQGKQQEGHPPKHKDSNCTALSGSTDLQSSSGSSGSGSGDTSGSDECGGNGSNNSNMLALQVAAAQILETEECQ